MMKTKREGGKENRVNNTRNFGFTVFAVIAIRFPRFQFFVFVEILLPTISTLDFDCSVWSWKQSTCRLRLTRMACDDASGDKVAVTV